jgi:hypothetical protein
MPETRLREIDLGSLPTDGSAVMPPPDEGPFWQNDGKRGFLK